MLVISLIHLRLASLVSDSLARILIRHGDVVVLLKTHLMLDVWSSHSHVLDVEVLVLSTQTMPRLKVALHQVADLAARIRVNSVNCDGV
jgi:hypothetical protein